MRFHSARLAPYVAFWVCLGFIRTAGASTQTWVDLQGNSFTATPSEVLGPLGVFRTSNSGGRILPWRVLAPADCVRFYEQTRDKPGPAGDWASAKSVISQEIMGRVSRLQGGQLVEAHFDGQLEPELFLLFFANNAVGKSWDMLGHSVSPFNTLQQDFPGLVEGLFFGLWHNNLEHRAMAEQMNLPWLVANLRDEGKLETVAKLAPLGDKESYGLVVINREGVPIFSTSNPGEKELDEIFAKLRSLLDLMRPSNPRSWKDRAYYLQAVQPVVFAESHADPVLVGNPLVPTGLKKNKVTQVDASIDVAADGTVTSVNLESDASTPPNMVAPLREALKKSSIFVPAVDHGKFVPGVYHYHLAVPQ